MRSHFFPAFLWTWSTNKRKKITAVSFDLYGPFAQSITYIDDSFNANKKVRQQKIKKYSLLYYIIVELLTWNIIESLSMVI